MAYMVYGIFYKDFRIPPNKEYLLEEHIQLIWFLVLFYKIMLQKIPEELINVIGKIIF
jgi:hypothetical protein